MWARRCAVAALAGLALVRTAGAALLPDIPEQRVRVGDTLELVLKAESPDIDVYIERAPVEAVLLPASSGRWALRWTTPPRGVGTDVIRLGAVDRADRTRRESLEIVIVRGAARRGAPPPPAPVATPAPAPVAGSAWRLPAATPRALVAGRDWELRLPVLADGGVVPRPVNASLRGAPAGLVLASGEDGWLTLRWRPAAEQTGTHTVELIASDPADPSVEVRRRLVLGVRPAVVEVPAARHDTAMPDPVPDPEPEPGPKSEPESEPALVAASVAPPVVPTLETLTNQIVSAGTAVAFKVRPAGEELAVVRVDRLPRNASFDENSDGSRTFYWPTSDRDQGEHRFRFTATDPIDPALVDEADVLVIVGDPSRGRTAPAGEPVR